MKNIQKGDTLLAGLDIGTTGCKVTVYSTDGGCLGRVYRDYPVCRTASKHEVDAAQIWLAVQQVLAQAAQAYPGIRGIGVSSFGESFVLLDEADCPLCNTLLYTDPRGEQECTTLCRLVGVEKLLQITGLKPHPMYSISKLMWMQKNQPALYAKAKRILLMGDYIIYMLTGMAQIDASLASRTMAFNIHQLAWSDEILAAAQIDKTLLSTIVSTGAVCGVLRPPLAGALGLEDTQIIVCGHDQVAAAVGCGMFDEGVAVDGAGTVECITPVFRGTPNLEAMSRGCYAAVPYLEANQYVCYAFSFTGGALVKWFVDHLAGYAAINAQKSNTSVYRVLEGDVPLDSPTGLLVLPHFAGAATPYMDPGSKGAILGLTLSSTQQDIFCALMEGVCYEMLLNMRHLREAGVGFNRLIATGGGANSKVWLQMKADVLGVPVVALQSVEAGTAGCAMMAGVALGIFDTLRSAACVMVQEKGSYFPRENLHKEYQKLFDSYEKMYAVIRPLV